MSDLYAPYGIPRPMTPTYNSLLGKFGTKLPENLNVHSGALDQMIQQGQSTGPSAGARAILGRQQLDANARVAGATDNAMGAAAAQRGDLAAHGGLDMGARERTSQNMAKNIIMGRQNALAQNDTNRYNTLAQDEDRKLGMVREGVNADLSNQRFNTGQVMQERGAENQYNMDKYGNELKTWGDTVQAKATQESSK
jgi:hypothetical protein